MSLLFLMVSPCLGEAIDIAVQFVDDGWKIDQRLIHFWIVVKSVTGEKLAREHISVLSLLFMALIHKLLVAMKDHVSVNEVVVRTLKIAYPADREANGYLQCNSLVDSLGSDWAGLSLVCRCFSFFMKEWSWLLDNHHKVASLFYRSIKESTTWGETSCSHELGKTIVTATYSLEGNGPLVVDGCEKIESVKAAICMPTLQWLCNIAENSLL